MKQGKVVSSIIIGLFLLLPFQTNLFADTIVVDANVSTGQVMWGAIGFLYGLGVNTPNDDMIAGLGHPQVTCQNAPNGAQHPDGYADQVAEQWKRVGGRRVNIYCQDIYPNWPYNNYGIEDYLSKLRTIAGTIANHPLRDFFSYTIFNEPNDIWYSASGPRFNDMLNDWKRSYDVIKSIHPNAKITGPNFSRYNSAAYRRFFTFARDNSCLPDYVSWHELFDSFFTDWYNNYNDFRQIESDLGIGHREIVINEYGRSHATSAYEDLGVPGNLIQFISRFENSKVYASLAYWTGHGTLNDLVANNNTNQHAIGSSFNQPTGAWYLYQWYGQMSGDTVQVTLPALNGSLQALASKEGKDVTVLFGGHPGLNDVFTVDLDVRGLTDGTANYTVYETNNTGRNVAPAPAIIASGTATVRGGRATISVKGAKAQSAYKVFISPDGPTPPNPPTPTPPPSGSKANYEFESGSLSGLAEVRSKSWASGRSIVGNIGNGSSNWVELNNVNIAQAGSVDATLIYASAESRTLYLSVNGGNAQAFTLASTGGWDTQGSAAMQIQGLRAGNNRLRFYNNGNWAPDLDAIAIVSSGSGSVPDDPGTRENLALTASITTSHVSRWETLGAVNDNVAPASSADTDNPQYGNWPETGTEWIQYEWSSDVTVDETKVYWFDDNLGIDLPSSARVLYWDGTNFVPIAYIGTEGNTFNAADLGLVSTTKLRLEMVSRGAFSTGVQEWQVWGH